MKLIEKIRTNNIYKFLFYIFLVLIIFNQLISYGVVSIYNNIKNNNTYINKASLEMSTETKNNVYSMLNILQI
jgi:hypothetical protein